MSCLDLLRGCAPGLVQLGVAAVVGELGRAIHRDPAHELRGHVVLGRAARLPDPLVGLAPHLHRALRLGLDDRPQPARQPVAAARVEQDRVEHRAEHVVLALVERAVADPHRPRSGVAREIVPRGLGQVAAAVDPVHDLERAVVVGLEVGDELHELVRLPVEVEEVQRLEREGRVAHPGEAVVPVALAARGLGEGRGQRRHRRPGRHVGEPLDRERRALDRVAPAVVRADGPARATHARTSSLRRAGRWPRRCPAAPPAPPPTRARSRSGRPARPRAWPAPGRPRSRPPCRSGA